MDATSLSRLELLEPWILTLVAMEIQPEVDKSHVPSLEDPAPVWIQWKYPSDQPPRQRTRMLEAVELFVLLARVDPLTWYTVVELMYATSHNGRKWTRCVLESHPQRRVCGYDIVCKLDDVASLCAFLSATPTDNERDAADSNEYKRVRALLEAELHETVKIAVRLQIEPRLLQAKHVGDALQCVAQLAVLQSGVDRDPTLMPCRLAQFRGRIQLVSNTLSCLMRTDTPLLDTLLRLQASGVNIATLPAPDVSLTPGNSAGFVRALNALLGTVSFTTTRRQAVTSVDLSLSNPPRTLIALLSALADAESVCDVSVNSPRATGEDVSTADRQRVMQWLAYALLRSPSQHQQNHQRSVRLRWCCSTLTTQDIKWMEEVVTAEDPLQVVFAGEYDNVSAYTLTRLTTSSVSLFNPLHGSAITEEFPLRNLRVLEHTGDWWTVLLPGWGPAWVHDTNATVSTISRGEVPKPLDTHGVAVRSLYEVELTGLHDASRDPAFLLLQLIGPAVKRLQLLDSNRPRDKSFARIFDLCLNIESLDLCDTNPGGLAGVADSFATGRCRHLKSLTLAIDMMPYETLADVTPLLHALADSQHAMATQLDVFEVDVNHMVDGENVVDSSVLEDALHMLENNTHLMFLKLSLPLATTVPGHARELQQAFAMHHNVALPEPCLPLGQREKAAFLSVVWGPLGQKTTQQQLDQSVVSSIFEWTLYPRHRRIDVAMPHQQAA